MALPHASAGQSIDVQPLGERLAGAKTMALFKAQDLEVMQLVLLAGKSLPPHQVAGEITIHASKAHSTSASTAAATCCTPGSCCSWQGVPCTA